MEVKKTFIVAQVSIDSGILCVEMNSHCKHTNPNRATLPPLKVNQHLQSCVDGRGGSWVGLLGSGGRFSRRTQGVWGAGPPTAGCTPKAKPDVF